MYGLYSYERPATGVVRKEEWEREGMGGIMDTQTKSGCPTTTGLEEKTRWERGLEVRDRGKSRKHKTKNKKQLHIVCLLLQVFRVNKHTYLGTVVVSLVLYLVKVVESSKRTRGRVG